MIIAFDVDGTLINFDNTPNHEVIDLMRWFYRNGDRIIVWSGGGVDYARHWVEKLGLAHMVTEVVYKDKGFNIDLAIDDEIVELGKINLKIERKGGPVA